jgi:hypothetical protein
MGFQPMIAVRRDDRSHAADEARAERSYSSAPLGQDRLSSAERRFVAALKLHESSTTHPA